MDQDNFVNPFASQATEEPQEEQFVNPFTSQTNGESQEQQFINPFISNNVPQPPPEERLTEEDWNMTEEDFIRKNKDKLARAYPHLSFTESTWDFNGVTAKNKYTGEEESFDLGAGFGS